jgi:DNA-binding LytR/AlgR family response regulator
MKATTAILVEDEGVLRGELRAQLRRLWPELDVVGEAANGVEALELLDRLSPDVMFLDIEMPVLSGLDVARQAQGRCHIAFVTAYDAYAVAAFDAGAVDYVLKPIESARLQLAIERLKKQLGNTPPNLELVLRELAGASAPRNYLRWITASVGESLRVITVDDVIYFQSDAKYTRVVTHDGEAFIRKPLQELLSELDPATFWPIHRSTVVNAHAIAGASRDLRGRLLLALKRRDERLPVSESHQHRFRQM